MANGLRVVTQPNGERVSQRVLLAQMIDREYQRLRAELRALAKREASLAQSIELLLEDTRPPNPSEGGFPVCGMSGLPTQDAVE